MDTTRCTSALVFMVCVATIACAQYSGGSGGPDDPYIIATPGDLNDIGLNPGHWGAHFTLADDIDLQDLGEPFNPIGVFVADDDPDNVPFAGVFDGQGHSIAHFSYESADETCVGLFRYVTGADTAIRNLRLTSPSVVATNGIRVGALAGLVEDAEITDCHVSSGSVTGQHKVGGLIGIGAGSAITDCRFHGSVNGFSFVGGLVGFFHGSEPDDEIVRCATTGDVTAVNDRVGGLAGAQWWGTTVRDSFSTCRVQGRTLVGGLIGLCDNRTETVRCAARGEVFGVYHNGYASDRVGGLVGYAYAGSNAYNNIVDCYATGSVDGHGNVGGLVGVSAGGQITRCFATGDVWAHQYGPVAGLVGFSDSMITQCRAQGGVALVDWDSGAVYSGGLVGENERGEIIDCYATGAVSGPLWVGGIVATTRINSTIQRCYAVGPLAKTVGGTAPGGIADSASDTAIEACFWDTDTTGTSDSDGGTGLNTPEMQMQSTYALAGWDFAALWWIDEGSGYPRFQFQPETRSDFDDDGDVDLTDFALLQRCANAAVLPPDCDFADIDGDDDADADDAGVFCDACMNGPDRAVPHNCTLY
jgi:hypothetical protein